MVMDEMYIDFFCRDIGPYEVNWLVPLQSSRSLFVCP